ncbi:hypothetical protein CALVIDRAFT_566248 [Calocera viscosa TUFC12733]|uniref:Uncharacterized protein n=1 Tax=Calocera viscosa (strain TUFC12733) TaxID=1330018 RepID=A0A167JPA0_CALVF|nr:hypothetical protein CALVIDRAFT_566248 [Calocera viscosa TUFC12733]
MSSLRVKVVSHPPLPPVRVWYDLAAACLRSATVGSLKVDICRDIPAFAESGLALAPGDLILEVDEFELLDVSSVSVIQAGDLVSVKARPGGAINGNLKQSKRRREIDHTVEGGELALKRRRIEEPVQNAIRLIQASGDAPRSLSSSEEDESSSEEESSTEESEEESEDESEGEAKDDSDEDSEESSDSSSEESDAESQTDGTGTKTAIQAAAGVGNGIILRKAFTTQMARLAAPPVPPGEGKPSTHSRNARRRKRKSLLKGADSTKDADSTPLAEEPPSPGPAARIRPEPSFTLPYDTPPPESSAGPSNTIDLEVGSGLTNRNKRKGFKKSMEGKTGQKIIFDSPRRPRFIPPSQKTDIPSNMFVTSVDCAERQNFAAGWADQQQSSNPSSAPFDWERIERAWDSFSAVSSITDLKAGDVVARKVLGLNRLTFSPEIMLNLAKVVAVSAEDGSGTILRTC